MSPNTTTVTFIPGRKTIMKMTEVWMYPFESLVAEFGGGLGLFLGFSFMNIWEVLECVIQFFIKKQ